MADRFTYEQLAQRVEALERELQGCRPDRTETAVQVDDGIRKTGEPFWQGHDQWYREIVDTSKDLMALIDSDGIFQGENGNIIGAVVVSRDITETKNLQEQLLQSQKMEAIGTLAGGIAHDFNNLMMGIQGRTSIMLADIDADHPHVEDLKGIEEHVRSASYLTRQLLGFAPGGKYEVKPLDLGAVDRDKNRMFGRMQKGIVIREELQPDLWPVKADRSQIEQVLLNVYINAWQAMPGSGTLTVQAANVHLDSSAVAAYRLSAGRTETVRSERAVTKNQ